ncbi:MAG: hypothetical protein ACREHE_04530 [Rhizomicrobium sp.]
MQIGANSLLIAAQHARQAQPTARPAAAQPAFEPLPLKQTAPKPDATMPRPQAAQPMARPGSTLDIRV